MRSIRTENTMPYKQRVTGSNPVAPTKKSLSRKWKTFLFYAIFHPLSLYPIFHLMRCRRRVIYFSFGEFYLFFNHIFILLKYYISVI